MKIGIHSFRPKTFPEIHQEGRTRFGLFVIWVACFRSFSSHGRWGSAYWCGPDYIASNRHPVACMKSPKPVPLQESFSGAFAVILTCSDVNLSHAMPCHAISEKDIAKISSERIHTKRERERAIYIYIYVYMYPTYYLPICTCLHLPAPTCTYLYLPVPTCTYLYLPVPTCTYVSTSMHACIHFYKQTYRHARI